MPMRETETSHKVSEGPWGSARFTQEQWAASCLLHTHAGVGKARLALPVREPNGALNRAACHDAAAFLAGARGGILDGPEGIRVDLLRGTAQEQRNAARTLVRIYRRDLGETPPESLLNKRGGSIGLSPAVRRHRCVRHQRNRPLSQALSSHRNSGTPSWQRPPLSPPAKRTGSWHDSPGVPVLAVQPKAGRVPDRGGLPP